LNAKQKGHNRLRVSFNPVTDHAPISELFIFNYIIDVLSQNFKEKNKKMRIYQEIVQYGSPLETRVRNGDFLQIFISDRAMGLVASMKSVLYGVVIVFFIS